MRKQAAPSGHLDRRQFVGTGCAAVAMPALATLLPSSAIAQSVAAASDPLEDWRQLGRLTARAANLGISVPRMSARIDIADGRDYTQIMPAVVELIESLETSVPLTPPPPGEVQRLIDEADSLLRRVHQAERNLPDPRETGQGVSTQAVRPSFESVKDEYRTLFETCVVRDKDRSTVDWYISQILKEASQKRWYTVAQGACCPWYFVSIIHAMEAAFNFRSHLHNGDSLSSRTWQVPKGRPKVWNPPSDWESSAIDAMDYDGFVDVSDWSLERTLYRWELYNGVRSRANGINTPYLWSFSNHYSKGKFVADNVWDPNAVSKQCGAAVMLKVLAERDLVRIASA
ncbi:MAG: hypothetical protein KJ587_13105 [Alphaproteobacteria bacterium]|nr:hypothetical protein [Alphaproteobacteria bacterium]